MSASVVEVAGRLLLRGRKIAPFRTTRRSSIGLLDCLTNARKLRRIPMPLGKMSRISIGRLASVRNMENVASTPSGSINASSKVFEGKPSTIFLVLTLQSATSRSTRSRSSAAMRLRRIVTLLLRASPR